MARESAPGGGILRRLVGAVGIVVLLCVQAGAQDAAVCARVKIEIVQELTFERQAFDARMRIENTLDSRALEEVAVEVSFVDDAGREVRATTNPNDLDALFFMRLDSLRGIADVSGAGRVAPASDAEIHWLVIPARGAAGEALEGKRYFVGAKLRYRLGGEAQEVTVAPDFITVRPQPLLQLDYFLTSEVRADDPFTARIEPPEPFTLGVRIHNTGRGAARNVNIDSAQPKIVENEQALLIGFSIVRSFVDEEPAQPTLLIKFGDIASQGTRTGRWVLETNLSGRFVDFAARFTHSDALGGRLTSLLERTSAHLLVRDVLVDLPGRDKIRDFLVSDGPLLKVYESQMVDSSVNDESAGAALIFRSEAQGIAEYELTLPPTAGMLYARVADPYDGAREVLGAVREDGKILNAANVWFSAAGQGSETKHYFSLFDANGGGSYRLRFGLRVLGRTAPVLQFIPDRTRREGQRVSFVVEASDPNGTVPTLALDSKPVGAAFSDQRNGVGVFDWPTAVGQAGRYPLTFRASDGALTAARTAVLTLTPLLDTDNDTLDDDWERRYFGDLARDGSGDFDHDGLTDKEEAELGTDPTDGTNAPSEPAIHAPALDAEVTERTPTLIVVNSTHGAEEVRYEFEVYEESGYQKLAASVAGVSEGQNITSWRVETALGDNQFYYWRARARNSEAAGVWTYGKFFVNTENESPLAFALRSPSDGAVVPDYQPTLEVDNSSDPDRDIVTYEFQVLTAGREPLLSVSDIGAGTAGYTAWRVPSALEEDRRYYWRALARDEHGASTAAPWASFFISTVNAAPSAPLPVSPVGGGAVSSPNVTLRANLSTDSEPGELSYLFELDTQPNFASGAKIASGPLPAVGAEAVFAVNGLSENVLYFWRVKASDGAAQSAWMTASFRVNAENDAPPVPAVRNPGHDAWVEVLSPELETHAVIDPDGDRVRYHFELFGDEALSDLIARGAAAAPSWQTPPLENHRMYYWRVLAEDELGLKSAYSPLHRFFVNEDGVNDPPYLRLFAPAVTEVKQGAQVEISWNDIDPDSSALVALTANGALIAKDLSEDVDGEGDRFVWNLAAAVAGDYWICGEITDGLLRAAAEGCFVLRVLAVKVDLDGDGVFDESDNCPFVANPDQRDRGTLVTSKRDGVGDLCQCGDVDASGKVTDADVKLISNALKKRPKVRLKRPELCDVTGNGVCNKSDATAIDKAVTAEKKLNKKKQTGGLAAVLKLQRCVAAKR